MTMKKIATTTSSTTNVEYDLVMTTYGELKELITKNTGMTNLELFSFDRDNERELEYPGDVDAQLKEIRDKKDRPKLGERYDALIDYRERFSNNNDIVAGIDSEIMGMGREEYIEHVLRVGIGNGLKSKLIKWSKPQLTEEEGEWYLNAKDKERRYYENLDIIEEKSADRIEKVEHAIESYFFVIEEKADGGYVLLDGFNRLFGSYYDNHQKEIFVKVYKNLDAVEYTQIVLEANDWKIKSNGYDENFLDRGVKLSLFMKYGIDLRKNFGYNGYRSMRNIGYMMNESETLPDLLNFINTVILKAERNQPYLHVLITAIAEKMHGHTTFGELLANGEVDKRLAEIDFGPMCKKLSSYSSETYAEKYIKGIMKDF